MKKNEHAVCPRCGHEFCPECGRPKYDPRPWYPIYPIYPSYPTYPYPWPVWTSNPTITGNTAS